MHWRVKMTTKISALRRSLISLAGVGGALIAAVVVGVVCAAPIPKLSLVAASVDVNPMAVTQSRICPGGLVDILSRNGDATTFQGFSAPAIAADVVNSTLSSTPLPAPDNAATDPSFGPSVVSAPPSADSQTPTLLAAAQAQETSAESISGLASAACGEGSTDQWLVGGSTEVGRNTLIFLSNALDVDATTSLEVFGEKGLVDAPGMTGILVKAHSQRIISLASFVPELVQPVVHITTVGGQVLASLQQTVTRVVTPSGVDLVQPGSAPALVQVIPGVALNGMANQDGEGGVVTSDLAPAIRVLIPGSVGGEVTATIVPPAGAPIVVKARVEGMHTLQLPFVGVPDGIYTVEVSAEVPLVAGVRTIQNSVDAPAPLTPAAPAAPGAAPAVPAAHSLTGGDFTWAASASALSAQTLVAVPVGPRPTLTLFNSTTQPTHMTLSQEGQEPRKIDLGSRASTVLEVAAGSKFTLSDAEGVYGAVTYQAVGRGASFALSPASRLGSAIRVYSN
jgi:hypothetical protein